MADVSVFDGDKWVSIAGDDGADGKDGKSLALSPAPPSAAINVANKKDENGNDIPGDATLQLALNAGLSDDETNVYDIVLGVPVGAKGDKGDKGEDGKGVQILGQLQNPIDTPVVGPPTQENTQNHDICTDEAGSAWLDKDGNLWVWASQTGECSDENPPTYTNVGSIQGPPGVGEDGEDGDPGSITLTQEVPVTFKTDCTAGGSGSFALDGAQVAPNANYQLSLTLPRGQHIYTGNATGSGEAIKPDDQTGDFATACTGDIWVLK